eukprot:TRINITY_DN570_c0_g1_i2.p1 TRINITY_DN570_c0_g1~~TRINITY_DN570_c0_g1_i2.p1  ORF type:complete len:108 (+),score=5.54 TRINITY_DN570_c0_g1_i2:54-377(+)
MTCKFEAIQKIPFAAFKLNEQVRQPMDYHYREVAENWAVQKRQKRFGPPFNLDTMLQTLISKLSLHKSLIDEFESLVLRTVGARLVSSSRKCPFTSIYKQTPACKGN